MQCFQKNIYLFILTQMLSWLSKAIASISVLDKGLVSLQKDSVGLQFYVDIENKDRISGCAVRYQNNYCCLTDGEEDCDTMFVFGGNSYLGPKDRETLLFVHPSVYQHDQIGYCNFTLDYLCNKNRRAKKQIVDIPFDTRIHTEKSKSNPLLKHYIEGQNKMSCDTLDQNPLRDCEPVNCDMKYSGERSYYDSDNGKCVEASICESNPENEMPDVVYVPSINTCRDLEHPLTVSDIYAITTGTGVVVEPPNGEEMKVEVRSNCSTISQNLKLLRDIMYGNLCPVLKSDMTDYSKCCRSAVLSILMYILGVCGLLLSFFLCIHTLTWLNKKCADGGFNDIGTNFKKMFKSPKTAKNYYGRGVNSDVKQTLLREVIVKDIPLELRESIENICDRMDKKIKKKKRYRCIDIGSQINLNQVEYNVRASATTSSTSSTEECDETQRFLK